jgi:hypothetical protein
MGNIDGYDGPLLSLNVVAAIGTSFLAREEVDSLFARAASAALSSYLFQDLRKQTIKPNSTFEVEFYAMEDSEHIHWLNGRVWLRMASNG